MTRHVLRTLFAVLLARSAALYLGLAMPQVAMACVFIVMQPNAELVLIKSAYRLAGTLAGALAIAVLAWLCAASPAGFLVGIGCWVALCTAIATFSTQFRAYAIVLAGYTAVIVGVPVAFEPRHAGAEALLRLLEVGLGILCAALLALPGGRAGAAGLLSSPAHGGVRQSADGAAALAAALLPASAILVIGSFWMATRWPGAAVATLNATVNCALAALAPAPLAAAKQMARGTLLAIVAALLIQAAYPVWGEALTLGLLVAPALALGAWFTGRPDRIGLGLGYSITLCMAALPAGAGAPGQPTHVQAAAGILLSVAALLAICAAARRLPVAPGRRPCNMTGVDRA
jgi:uncharacterized membrane protein YccC